MRRLSTALIAGLMTITLSTSAFSTEITFTPSFADRQICDPNGNFHEVNIRVNGRASNLCLGAVSLQASIGDEIQFKIWSEPFNIDALVWGPRKFTVEGDTPVVLEFSVDGSELRLLVRGVTAADARADKSLIDDDGDGLTDDEGDCNDWDATVHPGATEVCDNKDNDCDDEVDEGFDQDGDGHFQCDHHGIEADCDDSDATVYPGADELCDGQDNNCSGGLWYKERDDDGDGFSECDGDPYDDDASIYPGSSDLDDGAGADIVPPADEGDIVADALTGGGKKSETNVPVHLAGDDELHEERETLASRGGGHDPREEESDMRATRALAAAAVVAIVVTPVANGQDGTDDAVHESPFGNGFLMPFQPVNGCGKNPGDFAIVMPFTVPQYVDREGGYWFVYGGYSPERDTVARGCTDAEQQELVLRERLPKGLELLTAAGWPLDDPDIVTVNQASAWPGAAGVLVQWVRNPVDGDPGPPGLPGLDGRSGDDGDDGKDAVSAVYLGSSVLIHDMGGDYHWDTWDDVGFNIDGLLGIEVSIPPKRWFSIGGYLEMGVTLRSSRSHPIQVGGGVTLGFDSTPRRWVGLNFQVIPWGYGTGGMYWSSEREEPMTFGQAHYAGARLSFRFLNRVRVGVEVRAEYPFDLGDQPWNWGFGPFLTVDLYRFRR